MLFKQGLSRWRIRKGNEKRSLSFFTRFFFSFFSIMYIYNIRYYDDRFRELFLSSIAIPDRSTNYLFQNNIIACRIRRARRKSIEEIRRIGWELLSERNKFAIDANLGIKKEKEKRRKKKSWKLQWLIASRYSTLRKSSRKKEETLFLFDRYDASPINRENYSRLKAIGKISIQTSILLKGKSVDSILGMGVVWISIFHSVR